MSRPYLEQFILQELAKWKQQQVDMSARTRLEKWQDKPNVFFHFTNGVTSNEKAVPQLSLYVQSGFDTPIGIYGYPSKMIKDIWNNRIPYAADRQYVIVFQPTNPGAVKVVEDYTHDELMSDIDKLKKLFPLTDWFAIDDLVNGNAVNTITKKGQQRRGPWSTYRIDKLHLTRNLGILWGVTRYFADQDPKKWNKIFRQLGIQGIYDDSNTGIIHTNEPTQAVFFSEGYVESLDVIQNPLAQEDQQHFVKKTLWLHKQWVESGGTSGKRLVVHEDIDVGNFASMNLDGVNLEKAHLEGVSFYASTLRGANLKRAYLEGCRFANVDLTGANLENANLQGASFKNASLVQANLRVTSLNSVYFGAAHLEGADFTDADFGESKPSFYSARVDNKTKIDLPPGWVILNDKIVPNIVSKDQSNK